MGRIEMQKYFLHLRQRNKVNMTLDSPVGSSYYRTVVVAAGIFAVLYFFHRRARHRPLPGIPYNIDAAKRFAGDLAEIQQRKRESASIRPWFLEQAHRHQSAIVQIFLGPFARPSVIVSDFREANDILTQR